MPPWLCDFIEPVFKVKKRKTTIENEFMCGLIQFISCLYVLPVVPFQMKRVGYDEQPSIIATCATCAIGSIISGFLTDMPFIIAPPTSVSIFLAVSMQQSGLRPREGNAAVMLSGAALMLVGAIPPLGRFLTKVSSQHSVSMPELLPFSLADSRLHSSSDRHWYRDDHGISRIDGD
jgi:adenine/guanine/hypoxanthine permease